MDRLKHFQKYQQLYVVGALVIFFVINALTLATSRIMEEVGNEAMGLPFKSWEPFIWEFSSAILVLLLIPFVNHLLKSQYIGWSKPMRTMCICLICAMIFSLCHVVGMVLIRELVYWLAGSEYHFGPIAFGFLYELRKDLLTFVILIIVIQGYRFIDSRLRGEASMVSYGEGRPSMMDRLLVKKLGKEFIIKVEEVDWLESSGNYVNLYIGDNVYPFRSTMSDLTRTLEKQGFCRIHRSFGVNLDRVTLIENAENGGGDVTLVSGKSLPISRRYFSEIKKKLRV